MWTKGTGLVCSIRSFWAGSVGRRYSQGVRERGGGNLCSCGSRAFSMLFFPWGYHKAWASQASSSEIMLYSQGLSKFLLKDALCLRENFIMLQTNVHIKRKCYRNSIDEMEYKWTLTGHILLKSERGNSLICFPSPKAVGSKNSHTDLDFLFLRSSKGRLCFVGMQVVR